MACSFTLPPLSTLSYYFTKKLTIHHATNKFVLFTMGTTNSLGFNTVSFSIDYNILMIT